MKQLLKVFCGVSKLSCAVTLAWIAVGWQLQAGAQEREEDEAFTASASIEEVVVQGRLRTSAEALIDERMDDDVVMDFVDAEFISRVGDSTVASALRRVSGLTLVSDKFVYVRGLGERYSSTLLNGAVVPSPDLTRNVIPLDIFPTTIVKSLAVQKSFSPDMPAAFGGGSVNIRTKSIPDEFTYGLDLGLAIDTENNSNHLSYKGGGDDRWGSDDGSRALPAAISSALSQYQGNIDTQAILNNLRSTENPFASLADAQAINRQLGLALNRNISIEEESGSTNYDMKGYIGSTIYLGDEWELGVLVGGSYKRYWDDTESTARVFGAPDEQFEVERESTLKTDIHSNVNFGVRFTNDHKIETLSLYLRNTDDETAIRDFFNENRQRTDGRGFRDYRIKFEERDLVVNQIYGEHYLGYDTREMLPDWSIIAWLEDKVPEETRFSWKYSDSRARTRIPNEVTVNAVTVTDPDTGDVISSAVDVDSRVAIFRFTDLDDEVETAGWDWHAPFSFGASFVEVSGGYEWARKTRVYDQQQFSLGMFSFADQAALAGPLAQVFSDENILSPSNNFVVEVPGADNQSYLAAATTDAAYGKLDWTWNDTWRVMLGLRWEDYTQAALDWNNNCYDITQCPEIDPEELAQAIFKDDAIYPAFAITYITDWWAEVFQLRFGYSETVVRPDLREITDSGYIDPITDALVIGEPGAIPADITNYDIRAEWFFASGDNLTLSYYYKDILNPIEFFEAAASDTNVAREIINAAEGEVYGVEIEGFKSLGFLGDWGEAFFIQGNVTIQESEIVAGPEADAPTNPVRNMTGASDYVVNAIFGYDALSAKHAATLSYNVFGERLFLAGRNGAPDGIEQPYHSLDFTYTWYPTDFITMKLRLRNLLDDEISIEREGVETFVEKPGQTFAVNFQWDF